MSDKVGSAEPPPTTPTTTATTGTSKTTPKLLRDVLLSHQAASEQVMQDRAIMEALRPNLLSLIGNNNNNNSSNNNNNNNSSTNPGSTNGDSNGSNASSPGTSTAATSATTAAAAAAAAAAATVNSNAAALMSLAAEQNLFAPYLASALGQQQQLGTTAALDLFAYCQYISSMMLFKAMANGDSTASLGNGVTPGGGTSSDGRVSRSGDKSPSEPGSPSQLLMASAEMPQDYSMKNVLAAKLGAADSMSLGHSFDTHLGPTPLLRKEHKKSALLLEKNSLKGESHLGGGGHHNHGRKFISTERRPRQAYNTKQLERLEAEFQIDKYLTVSKRIELSCALNLSEVQIKTWFQNRRTKWKKQMIEWRRSSGESHKGSGGDGETMGSGGGSPNDQHHHHNHHHHHQHHGQDTNSSAISVTSDESNETHSVHGRRKRMKTYDFDNHNEIGEGDDDDDDDDEEDKTVDENASSRSDEIEIDLMSEHRGYDDEDEHDSD